MNLIKHEHRKHIEHIYLWFCMTIITLGALLVGFWLLYPYNTMVFTAPTTVDKKVYHPGDSISYFLSYCKKTSQVGTIYRSMVNGTITTFTPTTNNLPSGCRITKKSDLIIPENADEGTYHLEAIAVYKVNPIRNFTASWKSTEFKVVK